MLNLTVPPWNADFFQIIQCLYNFIEVSSTFLLFLRRFSCFRSRYVPSFLKLLIKIEKICGQLKRKRTQEIPLGNMCIYYCSHVLQVFNMEVKLC